MFPYADYEFYRSVYGGKIIKPSDFTVASLNATQYIKRVTLNRSDHYIGDELKYAACAVAEAYCAAYELCDQVHSKTKVKSENTDGYSVSYISQLKDGESSEEFFQRKAYEQVKLWLTGTNLLNRKVGYNCDHECGVHNL